MGEKVTVRLNFWVEQIIRNREENQYYLILQPNERGSHQPVKIPVRATEAQKVNVNDNLYLRLDPRGY